MAAYATKPVTLCLLPPCGEEIQCGFVSKIYVFGTFKNAFSKRRRRKKSSFLVTASCCKRFIRS